MQTPANPTTPSVTRTEDFTRLVSPRGIAIVGASDDPHRIGGEPVRALAEYGYKGKVYPVNPKRSDVRGLCCYASVTQVPEPCDVAVVAVGVVAAAKLAPQ